MTLRDLNGSSFQTPNVGSSVFAQACARYVPVWRQTPRTTRAFPRLMSSGNLVGVAAGAVLGAFMAGWDGAIHGAFAGFGVGNLAQVRLWSIWGKTRSAAWAVLLGV